MGEREREGERERGGGGGGGEWEVDKGFVRLWVDERVRKVKRER